MRERALYRPSFEHATPRGLEGFFSEVMASIIERPRELDVIVDLSEASPVAPLFLDLQEGKVQFQQQGKSKVCARFGRRWLAEHDVPMAFSSGETRFVFVPTVGERVKVRV